MTARNQQEREIDDLFGTPEDFAKIWGGYPEDNIPFTGLPLNPTHYSSEPGAEAWRATRGWPLVEERFLRRAKTKPTRQG